MKTSNEMCDRIVALLQREGYNVDVVNGNEVDADSVVEHAVDLDVNACGYVWSLQLTVLRLGRE